MAETLIPLNNKVLEEFLDTKGVKTKRALAKAIHKKPPTITTATTKGCPRQTINDIEDALGLTPEERQRLETVDPPLKTYTWQEAIAAASYVGGELFGEGKFNPDVIVSFPGPSALFAHLVLAKSRSREEMLRTPVHTTLLAKEEVPDREGYRRFPTVRRYDKKRYAILLPNRIFSYDPQKTKIAIIDDTVISGTTMESLRSIFVEVGYPRTHICVACFVCLEARTHSFETKPDIFEKAFLAPGEKFMLPWGPSFGYVNIGEL